MIRLGNISLFRKLAGQENVQALVHLDKGVSENEIISESRFADALITDAAISFSDIEKTQPTSPQRFSTHK